MRSMRSCSSGEHGVQLSPCLPTTAVEVLLSVSELHSVEFELIWRTVAILPVGTPWPMLPLEDPVDILPEKTAYKANTDAQSYLISLTLPEPHGNKYNL